MAFYFSSWFTEFYVCIVAAVLAYYAYFKAVSSKYWIKRNIPSAEPVFLLGNLWKAGILETLDSLLQDYYRNWKERKVVGIWNFLTPVLVVTDLALIKNILVRDFAYFRDHGFEIDSEKEPLAGHLFNLKGAKWRNLRVKLTPTFTSGKMKMMFPTMVDCGKQLEKYLERDAEKEREVEVKDVLARYTTDVIGSCAFGINTKSLENPDSEFRRFGRKLFEPSLSAIVSGFIFNFCPKLFYLLNLRFIPKDITEFFFGAVRDTMESRRANGLKRNDFMDLLIQLKDKGKLDDVDVPGSRESGEVSDAADIAFTMNDAAAQAFVFFFAGFETSSTTLTFALYELAMNADVQKTLHEEIDKALEETGGKLTYDKLMQMEYLDRVVSETLRKHPPAAALFRECTKDYEIPELGVKIEKKTVVFIPTLGIHRDPEIYPNPDKFDPDRFTPEQKAERDHYAFLAFGEGPRICIGNRFALLQTKIGLVSVLSRFKVIPSVKTPSPLVYDPQNFILTAKGGMHLKFAPRKSL